MGRNTQRGFVQEFKLELEMRAAASERERRDVVAGELSEPRCERGKPGFGKLRLNQSEKGLRCLVSSGR